MYNKIILNNHLCGVFSLWWSVSCVKLTGLWYVQIAGTILFLGMTARVCPEELSIGISRLRKQITFTNAGGIIQYAEGLNRTKMWRKGKSALSSWADTSIFLFPLDIRAPGSWTFRQIGTYATSVLTGGLQIQTEFYHWLCWLSSLQMANPGTSRSL